MTTNRGSHDHKYENMNRIKYILTTFLLLAAMADATAQVDKTDVRRGNRDFRKENFKEADIDYRKALVKDSTSVAANYNLANTLFRQGDMEQAKKMLEIGAWAVVVGGAITRPLEIASRFMAAVEDYKA